MDEATFDRLVSGFYKAATGASSWTDALQPVQQVFGARAALLHPWSLRDGRMLGLHVAGPQVERPVLDYVTRYHAQDPRKHEAAARGAAAAGQWLHCHEYLSPQQMATDSFCQDFLVAHDTRYNSNVSFPVSSDVMMGFALELPFERGPLNPDEREFARRLGVHLHDASLAHERVRRLMQQALAGHELLARYPYPMWLIDGQRAIHYANPAATQTCEQAERVATRGERLRLVATKADITLNQVLAQLERAGHGASAQVDLRPTEADAPAWLHLSVMVPGDSLGVFGEQRLVLATLFEPSHITALDTFALAQTFKLTPTEAVVAARLADGLTAEQIGDLLHIAQSTVRTHVRSVLTKLNAPRSADVVRMLRQGEALWSTQREHAGR